MTTPQSFDEVVKLLAARREAILAAHLSGDVHLVRYEPGRIEFRARPEAPANLATRLSRLLTDWTGQTWVVGLSHEAGAPTLREQDEERKIRRREDAAALPLVQAVLAAFPGAVIEAVRDLAAEGEGTDVEEAALELGTGLDGEMGEDE